MISLKRYSPLSTINSEQESEKYLSDMVTSGAIYARVDRPAKTVSFSKPKDANDVLNEWSGNIHNLLGLCEKLGHLITKVSYSMNMIDS